MTDQEGGPSNKRQLPWAMILAVLGAVFAFLSIPMVDRLLGGGSKEAVASSQAVAEPEAAKGGIERTPGVSDWLTESHEQPRNTATR